MIAGLFIAVGLFIYLGYLTNPGPQRAAAIQQLRQIAHESLAEEAASREAEIDAAFETLTELNREGRVGFRHVWRAATVVAAATTDGEFGNGDVESLLMAVGGIRQDAEDRRPRREPRSPRGPGTGARRGKRPVAGTGAPRGIRYRGTPVRRKRPKNSGNHIAATPPTIISPPTSGRHDSSTKPPDSRWTTTLM